MSARTASNAIELPWMSDNRAIRVTISARALEPSGNLAVLAHGDEVDTVERARFANARDEIARERDARGRVSFDRGQPGVGNRELPDVGADLAGHGDAGHDHDTRVDRPREVDGRPPIEHFLERKAHLRERSEERRVGK